MVGCPDLFLATSQTHAIAHNKQINDRSTLTREEWDRIASDLLPLQVKAYTIVRLAC